MAFGGAISAVPVMGSHQPVELRRFCWKEESPPGCESQEETQRPSQDLAYAGL